MSARDLEGLHHDGDSRRYWEALNQGRLELPHCLDCSRWIFYPRSHCHWCGGDALEWRIVDGQGTVHSWTRIPARDTDLPARFFALVDLTEGVRIFVEIIEVGPSGVSCEQPVVLAVDRGLPFFKLSHEEHR